MNRKKRIAALLLTLLMLTGLAACRRGTVPTTAPAPAPADAAQPPEPNASADARPDPGERETGAAAGTADEPADTTPDPAAEPVRPGTDESDDLNDPDDMPDWIPVALNLQNDNSAAHRQEIRYGEIPELRECYELATEIGNRYGVWIYIGDLVPDWIWDAGNEPQCDPVFVKRALFLMDEVLSVYPEGFFDQLVYGIYTRLDFYIVGFSPVGMGYVSKVQEESAVFGAARSYLCLDAEDDVQIDVLPYTLTHEITHLVDWRVQYVAANEEGHLYSDEAWMALNPEGFVYAWDDNDLELEMYDRYYEYFAYSYGAQNPLEDRATLMGELMDAAMDGRIGEGFYSLPFPCLEKLDFFFRCIRDSFDTSSWPEETVWEWALRRMREVSPPPL